MPTPDPHPCRTLHRVISELVPGSLVFASPSPYGRGDYRVLIVLPAELTRKPMQLELVTALEARGAYPPLPSIIWFRIVSESELESYFRVGSDSFINSFRKRHRGWRSKRLRREILFK